MPLNFKHINASEQIFDGSITTSLLADGSVTAPKLAVGAITSSSLVIDSNLNFQNFPVLNFRIENVATNPLPGNAGRLVFNTTVNDLFVDLETPITIAAISNAAFYIIAVTDATHLVVSSTVGVAAGDVITQGAVSTQVTIVVDATHLVVASTVGLVGQGIASVEFGIVSITPGAPGTLFVTNTVGMSSGDTITQGLTTTSIVSVTDSTHLVVADTTGLIVSAPPAIALVPFNVVSVTDSTHLVVTNTLGMGPGDTITQGIHSTTITSVTDSTHLIVASTTGWASNAAVDHTIIVSSTVGVLVGQYLVQNSVVSIITSIVDATHLIVASNAGFVVGPASIGYFTPMLEGSVVTSIMGTLDEVLVNGTAGIPQSGPITLTTPQPIGLSSSPTFAGLTLSSLSTAGVVHNNALGIVSSSLVVNADLTVGSYSNITGLGSQSQALNMNSHLISNVLDPVNPQDAVTKHYVDSLTAYHQDAFDITGPGNMFTLTYTPLPNSQVVLYNGVALTEGSSEDYTLSGNVVTLNGGIVLANGDKILIIYPY